MIYLFHQYLQILVSLIKYFSEVDFSCIYLQGFHNFLLFTQKYVISLFQNLDDWSFDVFALNEVAQGSPLKCIGYYLLNRHGLIRKFKIPPQTLENFLTKIEEGYCHHQNPYHNNLHATDVAQTMHYILYKTGFMV